ncbi:MAG: RNA-binding S4 domain-containing protein [Oscillospiraceae bacterium]|nr:RNA-binding S4 domain-containing protein [Oscillospiraceae bacterium]
MDVIKISTPFIKLQQLLKFADVVSDGSDAKILITEGFVFVNGEKEIRRGRKIYPEDNVFVEFEGQKISLKVVGEDN